MLALGCASQGHKDFSGEAPTHASFTPTYMSIVDGYSAGDKEYSGFYNQFDFRATLHNSQVQEELIKRQAEYYQWDPAKIASEREKVSQESSSASTVYMSFFTPERKNDNLTDGKSIWRVFLDVGGKRYLGKIKKSRKLIAELQTLYPYHSRWTTPYVVEFAVPRSTVDSNGSVLTITGPLGTRTADFKATTATATP